MTRKSGRRFEIEFFPVFLLLFPFASSAETLVIPSLGLGTSLYGTTFNGNAGEGASLSTEYTYSVSPEVLWISGKDLDVTYSLHGEVKRMAFNPLTYGSLSQNNVTLYRGGMTAGQKLGSFAASLGASLGNEIVFSTSGAFATRGDVGTALAPKAGIQISKTLLFQRGKELVLEAEAEADYLFGSRYKGFGAAIAARVPG